MIEPAVFVVALVCVVALVAIVCRHRFGARIGRDGIQFTSDPFKESDPDSDAKRRPED